MFYLLESQNETPSVFQVHVQKLQICNKTPSYHSNSQGIFFSGSSKFESRNDHVTQVTSNVVLEENTKLPNDPTTFLLENAPEDKTLNY